MRASQKKSEALVYSMVGPSKGRLNAPYVKQKADHNAVNAD